MPHIRSRGRIRLPTGSVGFGSPSLLESNSNLPCKIALPGHSTWATVAAPASQRDLLDARKMRVVSVASRACVGISDLAMTRTAWGENKSRLAQREGSDRQRCTTTQDQPGASPGE
jgi:hypothetical protein